MINMMIIRVSICASVVLLAACAAPAPEIARVTNSDVHTLAPRPLAADPPSTREVRARLLAHHASWRGTPHVWGGLSRSGVDCSGYIYRAYRDVFARSLPRTTRAQVQLGQGIPRAQLRDGDLVFFKTGPNKRHAGIYVGNGQFAHASYSEGVTISSLDNVYWKRHYWQSRRLL